MILIDEKAEARPFGTPLPKHILRISPVSRGIPGKTCSPEEFPVDGYDTYYLSSMFSGSMLLAIHPTLEVTPTIIIAPSIVPTVRNLHDVLAKYHPETLL
jgi:hypothetical protein